jgi:hypothetical protein
MLTRPSPEEVKKELSRTAAELIAESKRLREQAARLKRKAEQIRRAIADRDKR